MNRDFNNKIYNSIKRGISFALDDFEPEEIQVSKPKQEHISIISDWEISIKHISQKLLNSENKESLISLYDLLFATCALFKTKDISNDKLEKLLRITCLTDAEIYAVIEYIKDNDLLNREYVDLNLPSGTLWCTDNIGTEDGEFKSSGVTYNTNNGSYFIWGKLEENPKKSGGNELIQIKEPYKSQILNIKNKSFKLTLQDDAAYHINKHYRIPSYSQFKELFENTNIVKLPTTKLIICYSKKNPFDFISFRNEQSLYIVNELIRHSIRNNVYLVFAKLFKDGQFDFRMQQYDLWRDVLMPSIMGHIRPIYIIK